jgi:hypothetical protein
LALIEKESRVRIQESGEGFGIVENWNDGVYGISNSKHHIAGFRVSGVRIDRSES